MILFWLLFLASCRLFYVPRPLYKQILLALPSKCPESTHLWSLYLQVITTPIWITARSLCFQSGLWSSTFHKTVILSKCKLDHVNSHPLYPTPPITHKTECSVLTVACEALHDLGPGFLASHPFLWSNHTGHFAAVEHVSMFSAQDLCSCSHFCLEGASPKCAKFVPSFYLGLLSNISSSEMLSLSILSQESLTLLLLYILRV